MAKNALYSLRVLCVYGICKLCIYGVRHRLRCYRYKTELSDRRG